MQQFYFKSPECVPLTAHLQSPIIAWLFLKASILPGKSFESNKVDKKQNTCAQLN